MSNRLSTFTDNVKFVVKSQREINRSLTRALVNREISPYHYVKPIIQVASGVSDPPVGSTPHQVVYSNGKMRLLRFEPTKRIYRTPILFVYSMINRYYILDFLPGRSLIEFMRNQGYDVYAIDWGTPGAAEQRLGWEDYFGLIRNAIRWTKRFSESPDVSLYGYCMGGTMALAYAALNPQGIRNFIAQATPINFHDEGVFHQWTKPERFNVDAMVDAFGNVPIDLMETGFSMMAPVQRMTKWLEVFRRIDDPDFVSTFLAMEHWAADNIPFPGEVYRQYIKDCYQTNNLYKNQMVVGGQRIDLRRITAPLLNIIAENDTIAPPPSSEVITESVGSKDTATFRFKAGHIGLSTSSKGPKEFWPKIADWIGKHSEVIHEA